MAKGRKGMVKVGHRAGKGQDRGKDGDRVGVEDKTMDMVETRKRGGRYILWWKEEQLQVKSEGKTRLGRGQDKLEGRVEDQKEDREERKKAHGGWINRGLGKGKDGDQNVATGRAEGNR